MLIFLSSLRGASCFVDSAGQVDKFRRRYGSRQHPHSNAVPTSRSEQRSVPLVLHCADNSTVSSKSLNHMAFGAWRLRRSSASRTDAVQVDVMSYFGVAVLAA